MNLFELFASISLDTDNYENALDDASDKSKNFESRLKTGFATAGKVAGAVLTTTSTAVVALGKQSVDAYGSYEQLAGGVETLFGAGGKSLEEYAADVGKSVDEVRDEYNNLMAAQETVIRNAESAYKNAGLSMNQYMEQATSTAAAMINSLDGDTKRAADMVDLAITDMSDNANKMGSDIQSIQNAYGGFAKQNYTMLDNLKLGYGGTKEEMQRLLDKANELNAQQGKATDYQIESYADIVEAIHVVQTEMGITGATMKEAGDTIEGSIGAVKSSWQNWITSLGDSNADLGKKTDELISSAETAFENLIPVAERVLKSIGNVAETKGPEIISKLAEGLISSAPDILAAGGKLALALAEGILKGIVGLGKKIVNSIFGKNETETSFGSSGRFASGINYVPYNDFPAYLHRGEAVLTAKEAEYWRSGRMGAGTTNIYNMTVDAKNVRELNDMVSIAQNQRVATRMGVS